MIAAFVGLLAGQLAFELQVVDRDGLGCGRILAAGAEIETAPDLCVRDAFTARLEGEGIENVVVLVDAGEHVRVFVYRLEERRLVPRFLSSGFRTLEIFDVAPAARGALTVRARRRGGGAPVVLSCRFREFPLTCREETPS